MTEYNRFVSYIYVYENNQKTLNNGFVRVETRDNRCFVYIHMKDLYGNPQTTFDVYMVKRYDSKIRGILLGQMKRDGSQGEFYIETQKDNIENSGISLGEMAGIVIVGSQGQKYGTCWDDELLDMRSFHTAVPVAPMASEKAESGKIAAPRFISMPSSEMERVEDKTENEQNANDSNIMETVREANEQEESETLQIDDIGVMPNIKNVDDIQSSGMSTGKEPDKNDDMQEQTGTDDETGISENIKMRTESIALTADETAMREAALTAVPLVGRGAVKQPTLEEKLEKILNQGMKMYPFEDNEVEQCIRLELQDMGLLPMKFWSYVSNSFLLHNYYSYRHLILGRLSNGSYFLGVPGIGQPKDRFMAQLFGFSRFKGVRNSENGQSDFGYWYVILK